MQQLSILEQRFSNWGPWPPGGPLDGARGGRKEILEYEII